MTPRPNATRGAYFKARTRKYLQKHGYQVAALEVVHWIFTPKGRLPTKRDQFGSDILAMNGTEVVFVQVKGGEAARTGYFPDARRKFEEFTFPPGTKQWVVAWAPRAREPRILDMTRVPGA